MFVIPASQTYPFHLIVFIELPAEIVPVGVHVVHVYPSVLVNIFDVLRLASCPPAH